MNGWIATRKANRLLHVDAYMCNFTFPGLNHFPTLYIFL